MSPEPVKQELVIAVKADMSGMLDAFDALIEETTACRDRLRERLSDLSSPSSLKQGDA